MSDLIQVRRGTSAEWAAANPVLAVAEPGYDTTTGTFKLGDGVTAWAGLAATGGVAALAAALTSLFVPVAGGVVLTDAAQTIPTSTGTDITWGTELSDPDGWTSGGSATLTVPAGKGGRYLVTYAGAWTTATATLSTALALVNGSIVWAAPGETVTDHVTLTFLITLSAGDALTFRAYQGTGTNRDIVSRLEIAPV